MILNLVQDFLSNRQDELNRRLNANIKLKQIETELNLDMIGASESYIHYQLYIENTVEEDFEARGFDIINAQMEFVFLVANKNYTVYKTIFDKYVWEIKRLLRELSGYSNGNISRSLLVRDIKNINVTNAKRFEDDYYKPTIEFQMFTIDNVDNVAFATQEVGT